MRAGSPLKHSQRSVRLLIGFQGTHYEGWQSQKKDKTLQELFEKVLQKLFKEKTLITGSSRTDSGVHALGFVAHFRTKSALPDKKIKRALNFHLPADVVVYSARTVLAKVPGTLASTFHARFSAKSKLYRYRIWNSPTRPLLERPYVLWFPHRLDVARMRQAASCLKGRHDFSAFQDGGNDGRNPVRTIKRLSVRRIKNEIQIDVVGDAFLRHMVRVIVGTLIEAGRKKIPSSKLSAILRSKDRTQAGPTAKAHGLTLIKVRY